LALGKFEEFCDPTGPGVPLKGGNNRAVVLVDAGGDNSLRVIAKVDSGSRDRRFEGGEHTAIGNSVRLKLSQDKPPVLARDQPFLLQNGLNVNYGQIVALGGDFYGIPDAPISDGETLEERKKRFMACFNSLAACRTELCHSRLSNPGYTV
jgi:hypothetical protein